MAQVGKKNLTLFQVLRKKRAVKAKTVGNTDVPNLQESLVEVHVHSNTKRKAELPARPGKGKDVKKVRNLILGVFDLGRLLVVRVGNLNELILGVFDPGRLLVVRVGNLNELILEVFDPGHLLVVRVGNLIELMLGVFDPGRLLVVRVGNLNELILEVFDPDRLLVERVGNLHVREKRSEE